MNCFIIALAIATLVLTGCQGFDSPLTNVAANVNERVDTEKQLQENRTQALVKCQELCQEKLFSDGKDFDQGPCLSNAIAPDWVCDVVHVPRQPIDDEPANQCGAYRSGTAQHFVEIDGNCNVVRKQ